MIKKCEGDEGVTNWKHVIKVPSRNVVTIKCVIAKFGGTVSKPCDDGDVATLARAVVIPMVMKYEGNSAKLCDEEVTHWKQKPTKHVVTMHCMIKKSGGTEVRDGDKVYQNHTF